MIRITSFVKRSNIFVPKYYFLVQIIHAIICRDKSKSLRTTSIRQLRSQPNTFATDQWLNYWCQNEFIFYFWRYDFNCSTHDADTAFTWCFVWLSLKISYIVFFRVDSVYFCQVWSYDIWHMYTSRKPNLLVLCVALATDKLNEYQQIANS